MIIYGLQDPVTLELRYIGQTKHGLDSRLAGHCSPRTGNVHKRHWIQKLLRGGHEPEIFVIEENPSDPEEAEAFWIAYFKSLGCRLLNASNGGEFGLNRPRTLDEKRRISAAQKGREFSKRHKVKLKALRRNFFDQGGKPWNEGIPHTEIVKAKIRAANIGKVYSDEVNLKKGSGWRGKKRGPMPAEQRAKVSIAKKGKPLDMTSKQIAARNAKAWETRWRNGNAGVNGQQGKTAKEWKTRGKKIWRTRRARGTALWTTERGQPRSGLNA